MEEEAAAAAGGVSVAHRYSFPYRHRHNGEVSLVAGAGPPPPPPPPPSALPPPPSSDEDAGVWLREARPQPQSTAAPDVNPPPTPGAAACFERRLSSGSYLFEREEQGYVDGPQSRGAGLTKTPEGLPPGSSRAWFSPGVPANPAPREERSPSLAAAGQAIASGISALFGGGGAAAANGADEEAPRAHGGSGVRGTV